MELGLQCTSTDARAAVLSPMTWLTPGVQLDLMKRVRGEKGMKHRVDDLSEDVEHKPRYVASRP